MTDKITAADIRAALNRRYCHPEAAIAFEVAQGTGSSARRHLDAVAMELWPSRGMALIGIEIKVNLYDFRREAKDPQKAEEIARFCDYFWIAAPPGVVPIAEMPSAWGLMELQDDGRFRIAKAASKTEAQPVTRHFLAAMLRAAYRPVSGEDVDASLILRAKELEARFQERVKAAAQAELGARNEDAESWRRLKGALGYEPNDFAWTDDIVPAVRFVVETGFVKSYGSVRSLHEDLLKSAGTLGHWLELLQVPNADEMRKAVEVLRKRRAA